MEIREAEEDKKEQEDEMLRRMIEQKADKAVKQGCGCFAVVAILAILAYLFISFLLFLI